MSNEKYIIKVKVSKDKRGRDVLQQIGHATGQPWGLVAQVYGIPLSGWDGTLVIRRKSDEEKKDV